MQPISICTIIKNEEKHLTNYLNAIHKHLGSYPHETIIVDTGSDDASLSLIKDFSTNNPGECIQLSHFRWIDDFSAAKNYAIELAHNDWVFVLDADEYIKAFDVLSIDKMSTSHPKSLGMVDIINHTDDSVTYDRVVRFFNRKNFHFEGIIHEQVCPVFCKDPNISIEHVALPITIDHYGYTGSIAEKKNKVARNNGLLMKMLEKKPNDPYIYFQLGQSYASIHDHENAYKYFGKGLEFDVDEHLSYVRQMVVGYGHAMLDTGRIEDALSFEEIHDSFSGFADFLFLMGLIYMRNNMIDKAYNEFDKATRTTDFEVDGSNSYLAYYNMAVIDEAVGNTDKAINLYRKCGDYTPAKERLRLL